MSVALVSCSVPQTVQTVVGSVLIHKSTPITAVVVVNLVQVDVSVSTVLAPCSVAVEPRSVVRTVVLVVMRQETPAVQVLVSAVRVVLPRAHVTGHAVAVGRCVLVVAVVMSRKSVAPLAVAAVIPVWVVAVVLQRKFVVPHVVHLDKLVTPARVADICRGCVWCLGGHEVFEPCKLVDVAKAVGSDVTISPSGIIPSKFS